MIHKPAYFILAALVMGHGSVASADDYYDPNTGLPSQLFYAPLHELEARGMPMKDQAKAYMKEHPQPADQAKAYMQEYPQPAAGLVQRPRGRTRRTR